MPNTKRYDLEARTLEFARRVNVYVNNLSKTISNMENGRQLARSSGSTGANYIEANEALSKKDFIQDLRTAAFLGGRSPTPKSGFGQFLRYFAAVLFTVVRLRLVKSSQNASNLA